MSYWLGRGLLQVSLFVSLAALTGSCSSKDSGSTAAGASSSYGASSSSGGTGHAYVPPTCDQGCQDYLVGWALDDTIWFLWNQKLAGHPVGVQDITGACPLGGSVHVTGMDSVADGTTTTDVQFQLTACENSNRQYDLTFSGNVSMQGSFNGATNFTAEVFSAPGLDVSGALHWLDDPAIKQACDVTVSQKGGGMSSALNGRVCGRNFDEGSLAIGGSGGSSGQGGSGQGGSSSSSAGTASNNCACFCPDGSDCTGAKTPNPCGVDANGIPNACGCPVGCK
jgi:hypothetical protein